MLCWKKLHAHPRALEAASSLGCEPAAEEAALHAQPDCWLSACSAQGHRGEAMVIPAEATKRWQRGTQQNLSVSLKKCTKDGPECAVVLRHMDMQTDLSWGFTNINRNSMELQKYQSDSSNI